MTARLRAPGTELPFGRLPVEQPAAAYWTGGRGHDRYVSYLLMVSPEEKKRLPGLTREIGTASMVDTIRLGLLLVEAAKEQHPERLAEFRDQARLGKKT